MTIHCSSIDGRVIDALKQARATLSADEHPELRDLLDKAARDPASCHPQRLYNLGIDSVAAGSGVRDAEPIGWKFVVPHVDGSWAGVDLYDSRDDDVGYVFGGVHFGGHASATTALLSTLQEDDRFSKGSFTMSTLKVPALHAVAIWIQDDDRNDDVVIPLPPTHFGLETGRQYTVEDFDRALLGPAATKIKQFTSGGPDAG
jgi:hypothetical protein